MNIGIVVPHIGSSQISFYAIKEIHKLAHQGYEHDLVLFFEQLTPPLLQPQCATMCVNELMSFKGILITTNIENTIMTLSRNSRSNNQIIFYVWDLDWMRPGKNNFLYNYRAFSESTKVIARSQKHALAIENYSNRSPDKILENFNIKEMIK
jgi:hypothetical protein